MRRILFFLPAVIVLASLYSCRKVEPSVKAYFELGLEECQLYEEIEVKNLSTATGTVIGLCKWEWEDQVSWETNLTSLSFNSTGKKTVTLTVWAEEGVAPANVFSRTVTVFNNNEPPVVDFDMPSSAAQDQTITLTDRSTDNTGRIVSWVWNVAGVVSTAQNPTVRLISWGNNQDVSLTVTDNYGASNTLTKKINITQSSGHSLTKVWEKSYDTKGIVYWTSPAMSPDGSNIYVSSTGYHLVCFDKNGNQVGRYDIGKYGANPNRYDTNGNANIQNQSPTPSVGTDGKVYIPVQFFENPDNAPAGVLEASDGGLFCVNPLCASEAWYYSTGQKSTYRFVAAPVFRDYVAITLKENDSAKLSQNFGVINRQTGALVQAIVCDQGSYGGIAVASDLTLVYGASRSGAGYKVARMNGTWTTSANTDAGRLTNLLNGSGLDTKGFQPAISPDNLVYVCVSTGSSKQLMCACYDLNAYTGGVPKALWTTTVEANSSQCGYGAVLDEAGNAYFMSGTKIFRLNRYGGAKAWEYNINSGIGVAAIDNQGYLYVCSPGENKLLKLSSASGQLVAELSLPNPRSCPTIAPDGSIYITGNSNNLPSLYKVSSTGAGGSAIQPGVNWSQLGCDSRKSGVAPAR